MAIPQAVAEQVLVNCGRCCCLCRRFLPIRLQVHHIDEKAEGGSDDPDNLIALCLTCHTDVHTKAPFTRRFSAEELKQHRDRVFRLVAKDELIPGDETPDALTNLFQAVLAALAGQRSFELPPRSALGPAAVRILMAAVDARDVGMTGRIELVQWDSGSTVMAAGKYMSEGEYPREAAELRHGLQQLRGLDLVALDRSADRFLVTYEGYLLADQILAAGGQAL